MFLEGVLMNDDTDRHANATFHEVSNSQSYVRHSQTC